VTAEEPESKGASSSWTRVSESLVVGAAGLGAVASSFAVAPGRIGVCGAVLAVLVLAIAVIDRRRQIIPDSLNGLAFVGGLITAILNAEISPAAAALDALVRAGVMFSLFFVFRSVYRKMRGIEGMGFGDVKLSAVAGAWLDWSLLPAVVETAAFGALVVVLFGRLRGGRFEATARLPFGTYFGPAIWICWMFGVWRGD
jgi:leader peptidase (prepilin peptidase) / N-methyltransferase